MHSHPRWISRFEVKPNSWAYIPSPETFEQGKRIKGEVESRWAPPNFYYHLRAGGHVAALRSHIHHSFFARLDIKNFFSSIGRSRITRSLKGFFSYPKAREIAEDSTVAHPCADKSRQKSKKILPFGFVQSPILASLCMHKSALGRLLFRLHKQGRVAVSVYMDDIIVSSDSEEILKEIYERLMQAAEKSRFVINTDKSEGVGRKVTVFNIVLSRGEMRISCSRLSELIFDYQQATSQDQKNGIVGYVMSVNKQQANMLPHS